MFLKWLLKRRSLKWNRSFLKTRRTGKIKPSAVFRFEATVISDFVDFYVGTPRPPMVN